VEKRNRRQRQPDLTFSPMGRGTETDRHHRRRQRHDLSAISRLRSIASTSKLDDEALLRIRASWDFAARAVPRSARWQGSESKSVH